LEVKINAVIGSEESSKYLTQEELNKLCDSDVSTVSFSLAAGEVATIEIDLGTRYILDRVVYYYTGGVVSIEASESFGLWYTLPLNYAADYCYCSGISYKPRWLKITHTSTTTTAVGMEVSVYSGYTNILFGSSGLFHSFGIDSSGVEVQEIPVYNNTNTTKDICVFIEETSDDVDSLLAYSTTSSGVFYNIRDVGVNLPRDISWNSGLHINTEYDGIGLTISGSSVSGTYYSPVLNIGGHDDCRFFWSSHKPVGSKIDYFFSGVQEDCLGFRSFYVPPSGSWVSGALAEDYDYYWSVPSGSLPFYPVRRDDLVDIVPGSCVQFAVTITGSLADKPYLYAAGIEDALVLSSVQANSSSSVYVMTISGTLSGKSTNLLCFSKDE